MRGLGEEQDEAKLIFMFGGCGSSGYFDSRPLICLPLSLSQSMNTGHFAHVDFRWLVEGMKKEEVLPGSVTFRDSGMILSIPGGFGPYYIVGISKNTSFSGINSDTNKIRDIEADWAWVKDTTYVGLWFEEGVEYLFRFSLPSVR